MTFKQDAALCLLLIAVAVSICMWPQTINAASSPEGIIDKGFFGATIQQPFIRNPADATRLIEVYCQADIGWFRWVLCPSFRWDEWREKPKNEGFWEPYRSFALQAKAAGIEPMPTLSLSPHPASAAEMDAFLTYIEEFFTRSRQYGVRLVQVGNEPEARFFKGSMGEYADLLAKARARAKAVHPEAQVVMAGWTSGVTDKATEWLDVFFSKYGSARHFDAFDFHINYAFYPKGY